MSRPTKIIAAVIGVLFAVYALLAVVDFRIASSSTSTQSSVSKFSSNESKITGSQFPSSVSLWVDGADPLAASLKAELSQHLGATLGGTSIHLTNAPVSDSGNPAVVVQLPGRDVSWTPIYAKAALNVRLVYASDGDLSWRDGTPVVMGRPDGGPQIRVRGDIDMTDTTSGLISEPAYRTHLAEQIAAAVGGSLRQQLSN